MTNAKQRRRRRIQPTLAAGLLAVMGATACRDTFVPIDPAEQDFSISGYLNASEDTQWIRVMPMRPLVLTAPGPLEATVTLERPGTGQIIVLHDSSFAFPVNPELGSDIMYVHNYWTAERIEPGATYRFTARREPGEPATAEVAIPADYDLEVWLRGPGNNQRDYLRIAGLRDVAFVAATSSFFDSCGSADRRVYSPITGGPSDVHMIEISRTIPTRPGCGTPTVERREVLVVGSGAPWPTGADYAAGTQGTRVTSNIANSMGFIGGVLTKVVPYENCDLARYTSDETHCKLRYLPTSATLKGIVKDRNCGNQGLPRATVQLRELNRPAPGAIRIRTLASNRDGTFEIGALEAGIQYQLTVARDEIPDPDVREYETYTATLEFAAGETRLYEVPLRREVACGYTG